MGDGGKLCCGLLMAVLMCAVPIAMITLGAKHIDDCPMQPWIPKFMIVSGGVTLFIVLIAMCAFGAATSDRGGCAMGLMVLVLLAGLFLFGWQIAGSVWVFSEWKNWDKVKNSDTKGCHNDTYLLAFALLIIFWITCPCQTGGSTKAKDMQ